MKLYLICDNPDTAVGMRLAGVEGTVVGDASGVSAALKMLAENNEIAVILINQTLYTACDDAIRAFRKAHTTPLIIAIPDQTSPSVGDTLSDYIRETVGIRI